MPNKLLTLNQLLAFCREKHLTTFKANAQTPEIAVSLPAKMFAEDSERLGLLKVKIAIYHTGCNHNGSFISDKAARNAMPSIKNRPLLAYIHERDDGLLDFYEHNMRITDDGEIEFLEAPVGAFTEDAPFVETDRDTGKDFVCAYAYIPEDYTKAADILKRKGGVTANSCEIAINAFTYDSENNLLEIKDFYVIGSTLLGSTPDGTPINPGMHGSHAAIFSKNTKTPRQKGPSMTHLEKLLNTYGVTKDALPFNPEGKSDDALDALFKEHFTLYATERALIRTFTDKEKDIQEALNAKNLFLVSYTKKRLIAKDRLNNYFRIERDNKDAEPTPVNALFLTDDDLKTKENLENELKAFREKDERAKKEAILDQDAYKKFQDTKEFKDLRENIDTYTLEDIKVKAEIAFAKSVRRLGFALTDPSDQKKTTKKKTLPSDYKKTKSRYGNLFNA